MFDSREQLITHLREDMGITDDQKLEEIADAVMEEAKSDEGNPETLLQSIKNGAKSLMTDIGLETVSWVQNPSQDSMFVMMKDEENKIQKTTSIYKEPDQDWETVYGPVMRPNDIDKDGDVAPANDIKKAAHEFIAEGKVTQFDTDHDLNTGKGTLVESWILKEDKEYELPNGSTETIEKGSWMVGVQPNQEVKDRIKNGDITGWSIFGQADQISLKEQANFKTESETNNFNKEDTMPENQSTDGNNQQDSGELSIKDVHSELKEFKSEFKEYAETPEPTTVKSVDELEKHLENLEKDSTVVELGKDVEITAKEPEFNELGDMISYMEDNLKEENFQMLQDAITQSEDEEENVEEEMDEDEEEDEEQKEESEKAEDQEPNYKAQGKQGVGTENVEKSGTGFTYRDLTEEAWYYYEKSH